MCIIRPSTQPHALSVSWAEPQRVKHSLIELKDGEYRTQVRSAVATLSGALKRFFSFCVLGGRRFRDDVSDPSRIIGTFRFDSFQFSRTQTIAHGKRVFDGGRAGEEARDASYTDQRSKKRGI